MLFIWYIYIKEWYDYADYSCRRTHVWNLRDRLTDEVQDMDDILWGFEYIDTEQRYKYDTQNLFHPAKWNVWCSNKWDIADLKKVEALSHREFIGDYQEIISGLGYDPCMWLDGDWVFHSNQWDNYYIFTMPCPEASKVTMWWLLPRIWWFVLTMVSYLCISLFIYYKGVIYIIYWSKDK